MTTHHFTPTSWHHVLATLPPALTIESGDTVVTETIDANGWDKHGTKVWKAGNPMNGPIAVAHSHCSSIWPQTLTEGSPISVGRSGYFSSRYSAISQESRIHCPSSTIAGSRSVLPPVRSGMPVKPPGTISTSKPLCASAYLVAQTNGLIVAPLATRVSLPSWIGLTLGVMKDSALVLWLGLIELLRASQVLVTRLQEPLLILMICGAIYFLISFPIARLGGYLEKRWSND